jgi:cytochrome P450
MPYTAATIAAAGQREEINGGHMSETADFDLSSDSFFENPYPTFERLRAEAPVYFFAPLQSFILTRAADMEAFVKDPSFSSRRSGELLGGLGVTGEDEASKKMLATWSRIAFFQDPPRHTAIRQLISKGFSPAAVERLRPSIAKVVERALEKGRRQGEMDVVADFASDISINTLAELFAIPAEDRPKFMKWTVDVLKPAGAGAGGAEVTRMIVTSANDMYDYMMALADERRRAPGDDMISRFIRIEEEGSEFAGEAAIQSYQMVGAGYVTSMNQIASSVLALLRHPNELQKLRENQGLLKSAVEEALRYEASALSINRMCVRDTEIQGVKISKGQFVFAMIASANRDPALFPDPDRFDITRSQNRHIAFGVGPHYCPGASLSRMEVEEALRALLSLPRWELADQPFDYKGSNFQDRGPSSLHVRFPGAAGLQGTG